VKSSHFTVENPHGFAKSWGFLFLVVLDSKELKYAYFCSCA